MFPDPLMDTGALRAAIESLIARAQYSGHSFDWGFALTGAAIDETREHGHLEIVTPGERMPLTRDLLRRTDNRLLVWSGVWEMQLYVPVECERAAGSTPLPAVDFRLRTTSEVGAHIMMGQFPWFIARDWPWAILAAGRIEGWPP